MELSKEIAGLSFEEVQSHLTGEPFYLNIRGSQLHPTLYTISYDLIKSNFNSDVVNECRGIILEKGTNRIVCWPFSKFWNYGESRAAIIDWSTASVQEKYDGSLFKLYHYNDEWIVATNSMIDAREASVSKTNLTFYEIFFDCWRASAKLDDSTQILFHELDKNHIYIFEAMHPLVTTIVNHEIPQLCHIGTRNMCTYQEVSHISIPGIKSVRTFPLRTITDCLSFASQQKDASKFEGLVVVDAAYNRIKMKSVSYVAVHHAVNGVMGPDAHRMLAILMAEKDELQAYFPDERPELEQLSDAFKRVLEHTARILEQLNVLRLQKTDEDEQSVKKTIAIKAKTDSVSSIQFSILMACVKRQRDTSILLSAEELVRSELMEKYSKSPQAALELARIVRITDKLIETREPRNN
uniref:T4 RNA ligase 1-like N-terminal domain-containing protein n=1 Tax=Acrobeloides nanus TaxID=290746 RepID=A0A914EMA4_9BILA